jgi:N6-L-threonylcarbamoyladenine synthase
MLVLAIETSCDETSIAILQASKQALSKLKSGCSLNLSEIDANFKSFLVSTKVLGSVVSSQIKIHQKYGGVIPEVGARQHSKNIHQVLDLCLSSKNLSDQDNQLDNKLDILAKIDIIAVTVKPGLVSALRVGVEFAKSLKFFLEAKFKKQTQLIEVNHLQGHIFSSFLDQGFNNLTNKNNRQELIFPHLHLLVSGGNTQLYSLENPFEAKLLGQTLDDAAGETLDKIGRMLGLPYPGGVFVSKIAKNCQTNYFEFPVSMKNSKGLNFSFSGLKTAVRYFLQKSKIPDFGFEKPLTDKELSLLAESNSLANPKLEFIKKVCISAQSVLVAQLVLQTKKAYKNQEFESLGLSGGVSANPLLRQELSQISSNRVFLPTPELTGDNAIMIGLAGLIEGAILE